MIMAMKLETRKLVASLEKTSRKTKKKIWKDIADQMLKPTRNNTVVNVEKIGSLAEKFKGKTLVIPGKLLSKGDIYVSAKVVAISASPRAITKIETAKGEFVLLKNFVDDKVKVSELVLVK